MAVNMSKKDQDALKAAGEAWTAANKAGDKAAMEAAHAQAESIRANYGYSGGSDGSQYITKSSTKVNNGSRPSYAEEYKNNGAADKYGVDHRYAIEYPVSSSDLKKLQQYGDEYNAAAAAREQALAEATSEAEKAQIREYYTSIMDAAHENAEAIRAAYGYSGGADGSEFIPYLTGIISSSSGGGFSFEDAPTFTDEYAAQIEEMLNKILNRDDFSYNALDDPLYQQYREQYLREGDRAMRDTLGEVSARTGGLASSWAGTMAQQANNYYASQVADKIPELYQLAYDMYLDDIDGQVRDLGLLTDMSDTQYNRYRDTMSDWRDDRNFAYQVYRDDIADSRYDQEWNYNVGRDQISDSRYEREYADSQSNTTKAEAQDRINAYLAAFGSISELDSSLIAASGYTTSELKALESYYSGQKKSSSTYSGSSSGNQYSSGNSGSLDYEGLFEAARASGNPRSWLAQKANYTKYGFTSSSGLYSDYENWIENSAEGSAEGSADDPFWSSVFALGIGPTTATYIAELAQYGGIKENEDGSVEWANGWNAGNYLEKLRMAKSELGNLSEILSGLF